LLREARVNKGLSQIDVSKKLGYDSSQYISNWERSLAVPPVKSLKKIAGIYGISPQTLYDVFLKMTLERAKTDFHSEFHGKKRSAI
ncbi:MAG: helix-turn-helix domain-containing protein, partial [Pseudobdellovibrionaceae bacterium]